jgi:hypothetical protein
MRIPTTILICVALFGCGPTSGPDDLDAEGFDLRIPSSSGPAPIITAPVDGSTVNTHSILPAGRIETRSGHRLRTNGMTVIATVEGASLSQSCTAVVRGGLWACKSAIVIDADGGFQLSAVLRGSGRVGPPVSFVADTRPALLGPPGGVTNSLRPIFTGTRTGDGPVVRVCLAGDATCETPVCTSGLLAAETRAWSCAPDHDIFNLGEYARRTFVAVELDRNGRPGRPSPALPLFSSSDGGFGANLVPFAPRRAFNLGNTPFEFRGPSFCHTGETVRVRLLTVAGEPWPSREAQKSCSAPCLAPAQFPLAFVGGFSCTIDFTGTPDSEVQIEISETAPDGTFRSEIVTGFTVDLHRPPDAVITQTPPPVTGSTPPPIAGSGEPGAEIDARMSGTDVFGQSIHLFCVDADFAQPIVAADGAWSCSLWALGPAHGSVEALSDGDYVISVTQTDAAGNLQAGAPATASFRVRR